MNPAIHDAVIVGGGPAGAAAACRLAEAGRSVVLFERETGPHHKVCGEFVSVEAAGYLGKLGLDLPRLGALPIHSVRLVRGRSETTARLPFPAFSLSREVMDEALLRAAADRGAEIRRGVTVRSLAETGDRVTLQADGPVAARAALLATGKHDLRGHRRPPGSINDLIGFKQYLTLAPEQAARLAGHVEVLLFAGGYAGLQPAADGRANLCLVVAKPVYDRVGRRWESLLDHLREESPAFADRLAGAAACWERPLSIYGIPYGFVHRAGAPSRRLHRLGDQLAVIPSFCGDGMAIALHSAFLASDRVLAGQAALDGSPFAGQIRTATLLARAIRQPALQGFAAGAVRLAPGVLKAIAYATRVPEQAIP
ncbi:NAD(P)/FAD-dependent oxidoreductase [Skermanella pratensis]|uniref:NAD(P)/FAD-dependent oxidoreductase n=1 Tax=Skermanella pratensis TaxID=2233999 RepID=UPI00130171F5|nr:FAD-dependent oxidoreductase [Skermanella pratensis]